jgi:FkbM family methyltransferase
MNYETDAVIKQNIITTADGIRFHTSSHPYRIVTKIPEYQYGDIRSNDIVVDIGANAGAFALRAARLSKTVVAVEPVTFDLLEANIRLNGADIRIIRGALGDGRVAEIRWDASAVILRTNPLSEIIGMAGGCDFLKCDAEGAEWKIRPEDLTGVRRIEMELHMPPIGMPPEPALLEYIGRYYDFTIDRDPCHAPLGLFGFLHATRKT